MFVTPDPGPAPGASAAADLAALVREAAAGGVDAVQLRAKELASGPLFSLALAIIPECSRRGALLIVNDRLDVAAAAGAGGVHLGERSLPVAAAKQLAGQLARPLASLMVGASVHDVRGARAAAAAGADYLVYGNVFATASKPGSAGKGLASLAIGGVNAGNAGMVKLAGAQGIAVIGAIAGAPEPARAAAELVAAWRAARGAAGVFLDRADRDGGFRGADRG